MAKDEGEIGIPACESREAESGESSKGLGVMDFTQAERLSL
jgi:hypothetical protein